VRDIYEQALQRHRTAVRLLKMQRQMKMKIGPHSGISVQIESGGGDGQRTLQPPCAPPFLSASILGASVLTGQGLDVRRVLLLELALVGANRTYEPGDYLVVRPHNAAHLVDALLRRYLCVCLPLL
jgi:sulfite reductase alpha subunit-like flavoprotein